MAKKRIQKKVEKKIKDYVDVLKQDNLPIKKVILFGSYAKGTQHKWSDLDVCVVSPKFHNFFNDMQYLLIKRIDATSPHIEPVGLNPKDFHETSFLVEEIKRHGIEVKV